MERKYLSIHLFVRLKVYCENMLSAFFPLVPLFLSASFGIINDLVVGRETPATVIYDSRFIGAVSFMRLGDFLMLQKLEDILLSLQN